MAVDLDDVLKDKDLQDALDIIRNTNHIYHPKLLLGNSKKMVEIRATIDQIADTDITVLLGGESGTGKELLARTVYKKSHRSTKPFVKVLCAAIPDGLLESELFGHEKGSFTGAHTKKPGKFEFAENGTIFLDEIGEIPFSLQAKLLQVIQDREFSRIGGTEKKVDIRIIVATNKVLEDEVAKGHFREDLFYRLNVVNIVLPPLRERLEDIPVLIALFMEKFKIQFNRNDAVITSDMIGRLLNYHWPGNVRELENIIKRIVVLGETSVVLKKTAAYEAIDSSSKTVQSSETSVPTENGFNASLVPGYGTSGNESSDINTRNIDGQSQQGGYQKEQPAYSSNNLSSVDIEKIKQQDEKLSAIKSYIPSILKNGSISLKSIAREAAVKAEHDAIKEVLLHTHWNRKEAAKVLEISYKALLYKIKECGLEEE